MSRVLKVSQQNYRLQTAAGGVITLDTGTGLGTVVVTGNLDVKGTTTTVESTNTTIADNIIQLNYGQTGSGISAANNYISGVEIIRGSLSNAQLIFNEQISHYNALTASYVPGTFVMRTVDGSLSGLQVGAIAADSGADLVFDMQGGTHALLIANSTNYESRVTQDNHIPNKKYITNYVAASNGVATVDRIFYPTNATVGTAYASIQAFGTSINFSIAQTLVAALSAGGFAVNNINLFADTISNTSSNNLKLTGNTQNIEIDGILNLDNQSSVNVTSYGGAVSGKTKIYASATIGPGNTGLYIKNTTVSDELVSKNRAVLLSILL
jgi:hypothetical protein